MDAENINGNASGVKRPSSSPTDPAGAVQSGSTARQDWGMRERPAWWPSSMNLVLVGMFAAGILVLYLLSLRSGPTTATAAQQATEAKVEAALVELGKTASPDEQKATAALVNTFYYEAKQRQVGIDRINGNPFVYASSAEAGDLEGTKAGAVDAQKQQEMTEATRAVEKLQLQSVLQSEGGDRAMISNTVLQIGQQINGWTVTTIQPRQVVLTWKDHRYVLKMAR